MKLYVCLRTHGLSEGKGPAPYCPRCMDRLYDVSVLSSLGYIWFAAIESAYKLGGYMAAQEVYALGREVA